MRRVFLLLLTTTLTLCFAYDKPKGEIDMHGGQGDSLVKSRGLSTQLGLFKDDKKEKKTSDKKFIEIEKIEKIKKEKEIKND